MSQRRHLLHAGGAFLLLCTGLRPAYADRDRGQFVILQARYGTREYNVDVTDRLREVAHDDVRVRVSNELFGIDPVPGRRKTLRLITRERDGDIRTFDYDEYSTLDGSQFIGWGRGHWSHESWNEGWEGGDRHRRPDPNDGRDGRDEGFYQILQARYGTPDSHVDVTSRLMSLARQDRRVRITNDLFGIDPAPGRRKILRIHARGRDGQVRTFDYSEYDTIDGDQFTGWSRGGWGDRNWRGGWSGNDDQPAIIGVERNRALEPGPEARGPLRILRATYGASGKDWDITDRIRGLVRGNRLEVDVNNTLGGGDPYPGQRKILIVTYAFGNGPSREVRASERDTLRLP